jgi:putative ABC transport system permease protein
MTTRLLRISSFRYLLKHPLLMALSILGVALGVAVVVAIDLANTSATEAFRLSSEAVTGRATHSITGSRDLLDERVYRELRLSGSIREAAPIIDGYVSVPRDPGRTLQVIGVDPLVEGPFRAYTGAADSGLDLGQFMSARPTGLVSAFTATSLGVTEGDSLEVAFEGTRFVVSILGLINSESEQSARALDNVMVVDISTAQNLLRMDGKLSRIELIVPYSDEGVALLETIGGVLPEGAQIEPSASKTDTLAQMTRAFSLNLVALSLLALVVGMFLIYNTVTFSIVQRRAMIGRLRALGVTRREVFQLILGEALLIGTLGTILGLFAGVALGTGLVQLVTQSINDLYYVVRVRSFDVSLWSLAKGMALGIGATLLAAIPPAREATSAPASSVMRRSEEETKLYRIIPKLVWISLATAVVAFALLALPGNSIPVSYTALLLLILAFAGLTPGAVILFTRWFKPVLSLLGGVVGRMAAQGTVTSLSRTAVAIASLMIAISATIGVGVMVNSFRSTVEVWLSYTLQADVYISPPGLVFRRNDATLSPDVEAVLRNAPGVVAAYSVRTAEVTAGGRPSDLIVVEPGPQRDQGTRFKEGGRIWGDSDELEKVVVSEPYSFRYDVHEGDVIDIATDQGLRTFTVGGVYYDYGSDLGAIMMSRKTYEAHFDDRGISGISLYVEPGKDVEEVIRSLRIGLEGKQEVLMRSNRSLREASLDVFDRTFTVTIVLRLLAVLVAFIGVLSALMALQLERARELAVMRANGLTPRQVWKYVTLQTGFMGWMAGLFSIPLGLVLAYVLIFVINQRSFGWTLQMEWSPAILIQAVILALVAALLAGVYPAWKMSRAKPAEALRNE